MIVSNKKTETAAKPILAPNRSPVSECSIQQDDSFLAIDFLADLAPNASDTQFKAALTLNRIRPALENVWHEGLSDTDPDEVRSKKRDFCRRLKTHWHDLFERLLSLYGNRFDFHYHVEAMLLSAARAVLSRDKTLCQVDARREIQDDWFQQQTVVGGAVYVDLFSGNLNSLRENIDYFKQLGITYLHLMPLFDSPAGNSDGGYAISDYRAVDPRLGTIAQLQKLATELRSEGISLVLDFVFNHTSDEHLWAKAAQSGDREYQEFYFLFPDRSQPDRYEQNLREIFPTVRRGNFTWHDGMGRWVWTTFNSFQWDLNYQNPSVFRSMMEEMLFIANVGIDVLRLDAVAFIWKQMGTSCENLPKAHTVIQAFNLFVRIAAPGLAFKSEAIVHPDEVVKYIGQSECQISYNPQLMALLWESLATRKIDLLYQALAHQSKLPAKTAWVNYLRCHDDIGWTFDDEDAQRIGINAYNHRRFLNQFYTGQFPGSFARGVPFQENLETGDMRVSGTLASLAGLEEALQKQDDRLIELSVNRIELLQTISMSIGGIPLLYLGEEWGVLNDYDYVLDPAKADDSRWIHRPKMDWDFVSDLCPPAKSTSDGGDSPLQSVHHRIYHRVRRMIELRKQQPALAGQDMELFETHNAHVLGFVRLHQGHRLLVLGNFSESEQSIDGNRLRTAGIGRFFRDLISNQSVKTSGDITLQPYQVSWLVRD